MIKLKITIDTQRFWLWLMRFAYHRATILNRVPDGIPTVRSMQAPCPGYSPRRAIPTDWTDCETDGHYLCQECCHRRPEGPLTYVERLKLRTGSPSEDTSTHSWVCNPGYCATKDSHYGGGGDKVRAKVFAGICPICGGTLERRSYERHR
jgi:hypothetical protein